MTLKEKASLMSGENFWNTKAIEGLGIPGIMLTDGPHGLRKQGGKEDHLGLHKSLPATCFPTAAGLANSWNPKLLYRVGKLLGRESVGERVSVLLGPGLNIKRNPLCGRNFEYFSEDPYLTGHLAAEMVKGIQSTGVAACPKHFAVNSQEHLRMSIDEIVDERSLRELYLEGFRLVVEEGKPRTIMSSYNKVNGEFANESKYLLTDVLRDEWGFDGVVVTDWGGNFNRVKGLEAGNQLEMPASNGITDAEIIAAVESGELDESLLNQAVDDLLRLAFEGCYDEEESIAIDYAKHHKEAVKVAEETIVLLKNEGESLPLKEGERIALIGDFAKNPRYQGAGSSLINPSKLSNAYDELMASPLTIIGYEQGFKRRGGESRRRLNRALSLAKKADKVLLFLGLDEGNEAETIDRKNLKLNENQLRLAKELMKVHKNVILILSGGGAIEMPFVQEAKAIVHSYLAGQGGAEALVNILSGKTNPSAKLAETLPIKYEDSPSAPYYPGKEVTAEHREGLFIGYRYFDKREKEVQFPFGHGLSYTTFSYSNLKLDEEGVSLEIKNIGDRAGQEIVQLYIEKENTEIVRPKKELKGFKKVSLEPGEKKNIRIALERRDFAYYDAEFEDWLVEPGDYQVKLGSSSRDIRLQGRVRLEGDELSTYYSKERLANYFTGDVKEIGPKEFETLLGAKLKESKWDRKKDLGLADTIAQAKYKNWFGRLFYQTIMFAHRFLKFIGKPLAANNIFFVLNMRFQQIEGFTRGKISRKTVQRMLNIINK